MTTNRHGNEVSRSFRPTGRYEWDYSLSKDWLQFDTSQDADYFGVWVNPVDQKIITYAEGDITETICPTWKGYIGEIEEMIEFYNEGFEFKSVDLDKGEVTEYCQDRKKFLIKPEGA